MSDDSEFEGRTASKQVGLAIFPAAAPDALFFERRGPLPEPKPIRRHLLEHRRGVSLGALRTGDLFTTRLTARRGMVIGQGRGDVSEPGESTITVRNPPGSPFKTREVTVESRALLKLAPYTTVQWSAPGYDADLNPKHEGWSDPVDLAPTIVVVPGWWTPLGGGR